MKLLQKFYAYPAESPNEKAFQSKYWKKFGNKEFVSPALNAELEHLSIEALKYITTLKTANIPMQYWNSETMNWLLIQWGRGVYPDHQTLLAQYDVYLAQNKPVQNE